MTEFETPILQDQSDTPNSITVPKGSRIVVKTGTSSITKVNALGYVEFDRRAMSHIANQVCRLRDELGVEPVLVSSGAIAAGMIATGMHVQDRPSKETAMPQLQRLAALGWHPLLGAWQKVYGEQVLVGGLLVSRSDLMCREGSSALEFNGTINAMLDHGHIPIVNENDALTHEEISFGDNDILGYHIAATIGAVAFVPMSSCQPSILGSGGGESKQVAMTMAANDGIQARIIDAREHNALFNLIKVAA